VRGDARVRESRRLAIVATALLLTTPAVGSSAERPAGLDVSPSLLEVTIKPGDRLERTVTVTNPGEEPLAISIEAGDWTMDATGEVHFEGPGSHPRSCARWIAVSPSKLVLPPRGQSAVQLSFQSPPEFSGTHWAVVFFSLADRASAIEGRPVTVAPRVGLTVYATAAGTEKGNLRFTKTSASASDRSVQLRALFENGGNTVERVRLTWQIRTANGRIVKTLVASVVCLPGARREAMTETDPLASGTYRVTAMARWGMHQWQAKDCDLAVQ